jgi:hypothetical protein
VRWSRFDCGLSRTCTFVPDADFDWITAIFTPLQLEAGVEGSGTVATAGPGSPVALACDPGLSFGTTTCHGVRPADTDVTLIAQGASTRWGRGCEPTGDDPTSSTCTVSMCKVRTLAAVAFDGVTPSEFPFQIATKVRVLKG